MELHNTYTAQKIKMKKLQFERDDNKKRLDSLNEEIGKVNTAAEEEEGKRDHARGSVEGGKTAERAHTDD